MGTLSMQCRQCRQMPNNDNPSPCSMSTVNVDQRVNDANSRPMRSAQEGANLLACSNRVNVQLRCWEESKEHRRSRLQLATRQSTWRNAKNLPQQDVAQERLTVVRRWAPRVCLGSLPLLAFPACVFFGSFRAMVNVAKAKQDMVFAVTSGAGHVIYLGAPLWHHQAGSFFCPPPLSPGGVYLRQCNECFMVTTLTAVGSGRKRVQSTGWR